MTKRQRKIDTNSPKPSDFFCVDCNIDTSLNDRDYYMLKDSVWESIFSGSGCLCVSCAERRLGHKFRAEDILVCPLTTEYNPYTKQILRGF